MIFQGAVNRKINFLKIKLILGVDKKRKLR